MHKIYNLHNAVHKENMAAFDYDWTLVCPKDGKTFPSNTDDWKWLYPSVPDILKDYHEKDFMIVIFTNQSKLWKHTQIQNALNTLNIPVFIVVATDRSLYKPSITLFDSLVGNSHINRETSFYVGDAMGRPCDFANTDLLFAKNMNVRAFSPEQIFVSNASVVAPTIHIELLSEPEIIILVGFPGSGKSTIAKHICQNNKYVHIESDIHKTTAKMLKASLPHISENKSIVFDATNSSSKKRKEFIDFAKSINYHITCIYVSTSSEISFQRNVLRSEDKQVPKIAYSVYSKHFVQPCQTEGFRLITV
jgi:bifunctional polynucleotide phosphatase/kinase